MMRVIVAKDELPNNGSVYKFEGYRYGGANVSFSLSETPPGGQIVAVPAGVPQKFVNSGARRARHVDIHASGRVTQTEWLEDQESGGMGW
jgi:hypothetical protein